MRDKIIVKFLIKIKNEFQEELKEYLNKAFNLPVKIEKENLNLNFAFNSKRKQYLANLILEKFGKKKNQNEKWLIVSEVDLYTNDLNFVFDLADIESQIAVISSIRLRQEFYGLKENEKLFLERIKKEVTHELSHLFYLNHCQNSKCVMYFSNSLKDTDFKNSVFCQKCEKILQSYLGKK